MVMKNRFRMVSRFRMVNRFVMLVDWLMVIMNRFRMVLFYSMYLMDFEGASRGFKKDKKYLYVDLGTAKRTSRPQLTGM